LRERATMLRYTYRSYINVIHALVEIIFLHTQTHTQSIINPRHV